MPTINELKTTHAANVVGLQGILTGGKLTADQKQTASDFLAGLAVLIANDAPVVYRIEDNVRTVRLREGRDPSQSPVN